MKYQLLGKPVRGRFAFPSGVIATNPDTARWMLENVPQIGAVIGKSTTIEPRIGQREDIFDQPTPDSGWNAVAFSNPGLAETIAAFKDLKMQFPKGIFFMPQIGENNPGRFATCIREFEIADAADGYEINVSCGHASRGGIQLSQPETVEVVFRAMRKETKKPLVAKLNASSDELEDLVRYAVRGGANAISLINTLPGPNPELKNKYGGLSGIPIFPVLKETLKTVRSITNVPIIAMGGISNASDIRQLEKIDPDLFYEIGTSLAELTSNDIKSYFAQLEKDLEKGSNLAAKLTTGKKGLKYHPFIVKKIVSHTEDLITIKFHETFNSGIGQYVFLKVGNMSAFAGQTDEEYAKPFSVADDTSGLELVVRRIGPATAKIFELKKNQVVRIKGPFGSMFQFPKGKTPILVGGGCGIAPVYHAAVRHASTNVIVLLGARTKNELIYLDNFKELGQVFVATDDGSEGMKGQLPDLLEDFCKTNLPSAPCFFNCGPEVVMAKSEVIEKKVTEPKNIFHLVERMTCCGVGICGKCSVPNGKRACLDGPVFNAEEFTPGQYTRDKSGRVIYY